MNSLVLRNATRVLRHIPLTTRLALYPSRSLSTPKQFSYTSQPLPHPSKSSSSSKSRPPPPEAQKDPSGTFSAEHIVTATSVTHFDSAGQPSLFLDAETDFTSPDYDWGALERRAGIVDGYTSKFCGTLDSLPDDCREFEVILDAESGELEFNFDAADGTDSDIVDGADGDFVEDSDVTVEQIGGGVSGDSEPRLQTRGLEGGKESRLGGGERLFAPPLPLHAPQVGRPGAARRAAMLEAEMARVVAEVAAVKGWSGDVDAVGLGADLRDLTVFYSGGEEGVAEMEREVRGAIAKRMDLRYAPKVRFLREDEREEGRRIETDELEGLFDRIGREREERRM